MMPQSLLLFIFASSVGAESEYRQKNFREENYLNDVTAVILRREEVSVSRLRCVLLCLQTERCSDVRLVGDPLSACDLIKGTAPGDNSFMYTKGASEVCTNKTLGMENDLYTDGLSIAQTYGKITKVEVWAGYIVDGFRLQYGSYVSPIQGGSSGGYFFFDLSEDEFITGVSAGLAKFLPEEPSLHFLDDCLGLLSFRTNHGNEFGPFGNINYNVPDGQTRIKPGSYIVSTGYRMVTMYYGPKPIDRYSETIVPVFNACL